MKKKTQLAKAIAIFLAFMLVTSQVVIAQSGTGEDKNFKQEELDQLLAPIALYPDSLLAQIFMASTYPLEVVEAGRWVKANKDLKGDAVTAALEKENWDPSVKSLVNFPQVLDFMNEKLKWTQKLGNAFLAQKKEVMDTVQTLRKKAKEEGNLESSKEQTVVIEKETIIIQPASPQVVYVPTYNPTVVYGAWWYPSYPPYYYYPRAYPVASAAFTFGVGVAVGAAWGYAWGGCNWRGGNVDIDVNRNKNVNRNIDRDKYKNKANNRKGEWKHNPEHRKGVSYRDQGTAKKYDRGASKNAASRDAFRGRAETGRKDIARGDANKFKGKSGSMGSQNRSKSGSMGRSQANQRKSSSGFSSPKSNQRSSKSAFGSSNRGSKTRSNSNRGHQSMSRGGSGHSRSSGSGGRSRSGGGGSRGGGGRR
jgi:hypothetical protein